MQYQVFELCNKIVDDGLDYLFDQRCMPAATEDTRTGTGLVCIDFEMFRCALQARRIASTIPRMDPLNLQPRSRLLSMTRDELLAYALHHACTDAAVPARSVRESPSRAVATERGHMVASGESAPPDVASLSAKEGCSSNELTTKSNLKNNREREMTLSRHGGGTPPRKKPRRDFDMSKYGQRMIALKFNYQGWKFHGFASQATTNKTVEDYLFAALLRTHLIESRDSCFYTRAGRTDVGVSAAGQVIGIRVRSGLVPPSKEVRELDYLKMLNSNLPDGIRVTAWSPVCDGDSPLPVIYPGDLPAMRDYWSRVERTVNDSTVWKEAKKFVRRPGERFSARFDALSRSYRYFFARGSLDLLAMAEAAAYFIGRHDFRNFCRIDEGVDNFERVMHDVEIRRASDDERVGSDGSACGDVGQAFEMYYIFVRGQAFLWHQVRCMAAVLFDVGLRHETPSVVRDMLIDATNESGDFSRGRPQYRIASATPLVFWECEFPESVVWFGGCVENVNEGEGKAWPIKSVVKADAHISESWAEAAAKCEILRTMFPTQPLQYERVLLIGNIVSRHVPYRTRARDPPLWKRRKQTIVTGNSAV